MKPQPQSITSLPPSPTDERRGRVVKYSIAMAVRLICIGAMFFVQGWWLLAMLLAAVILPYIAVVLANVGNTSGGAVERPGAIVRVEPRPPV